ncbi:ankyrin repeat domain-containing protein 39 [Otolemur garnettii]|uniref:ankyrin repeat domain-containing protein 39 n=1 Tax=Otolemur garnettii TaxID=30611 RepID=UPI000C7F318D|nr:ankyrin repeat domain-containing protein 39 [Otolemur garnettii]
MAAPRPCADGPCCSHLSAVSGVQQTLEEMDFERGIWSAALNGDLGRVKYLIQKATDPSQPDSAGYTALVSWGETRVKREKSFNSGWSPVRGRGVCFLIRTLSPQAAEKGHMDICSLLLQHSPALKAVRDRKARLACDLLPFNSDLRNLLAS